MAPLETTAKDVRGELAEMLLDINRQALQNNGAFGVLSSDLQRYQQDTLTDDTEESLEVLWGILPVS